VANVPKSDSSVNEKLTVSTPNKRSKSSDSTKENPAKKQKTSHTSNSAITNATKADTSKETTKDKKRKQPDKPAPKRPCTPYMYFNKNNRAKIKEENPDKTAKDITKLLAATWKDLSEGEKKQFVDMAAKDKERYQNEMKEYEDIPSEPPTKKAKSTKKLQTKGQNEKKKDLCKGRWKCS